MTFYPFMAKIANIFKNIIKVKTGDVEKITEIDEHKTIEQTNNLFFSLFFSIHNHLVDKLRFKARNTGIIRQLLPKDFGLKNRTWSKGITRTGSTICCVIPDNTYIGVWGFNIPKDCKIREIEIINSGKRTHLWNIENMSGDYFFDDTFTLDPGRKLIINTYPRRAKFNIKFYGNVAEEKGITIL